MGREENEGRNKCAGETKGNLTDRPTDLGSQSRILQLKLETSSARPGS
jgi:hypothetical protein